MIGRKRVSARAAVPLGITLALPALLLVGVLYLTPLLRLAVVSFGESGEHSWTAYAELFGQWSYAPVLGRTLLLTFMVVLGCLVLGYPIAYLLAFAPPRRRSILALIVFLPFWSSVLVRNFAWIYLLRDDGLLTAAARWIAGPAVHLLYNEAGVVIGMVNTLLPFMVLPIFASIDSQDSSLRDAAASLGASPSRILLSITLPLSRAGIASGSLLVALTAAGFFVTPALLGGGRILVAASFIDGQIENAVDWPLAAAASTVLLAAVIVIVLLCRRLMRIDLFGRSHVAG